RSAHRELCAARGGVGLLERARDPARRFRAAGEPDRSAPQGAAATGATGPAAPAARTSVAQVHRRSVAARDVLAVDSRVDLRHLGAAQVRVRPAYGRAAVVLRGLARVAHAGRTRTDSRSAPGRT